MSIKINFPDSPYQFFELNNGIRTIHKHVPSLISHIGIMIQVGSRDEDKSEAGIAHFIEHVIFKGTKKRNVFQILNRIEQVGGDLNAFTTREETCIHASFVNDYFERTIELFADVLKNATFPEKEIEKEKQIVLDEINSYKDNPVDELFEDFESAMFPEHPLGKNILGNKKTIKKISRNQIFDFVQKHYNGNKIVISTFGNITFEKLQKIIHLYFDDFPSEYFHSNRKTPDFYVKFEKEKNKKTFQTHCILGNRCYDLNNNDRYVFSLINNYLGGPSMNAALSFLLREKHGICYNIEANYTPYTDAGYFSVYFGCDNGAVDKAFQLIKKEFDKLREKKLSKAQLEKIKIQYLGQAALTLETGLQETLMMAKSIINFNHCENFMHFCQKIEKISAEDILRVANETLDFNDFSTIIFRSKK